VERQLKKTLINQSEILTLCGTALILDDFLKMGIALILTGIFGALARYAVDFQILSEKKEEAQDSINDALETIL
jgi:hypothetical protein